MSDKYFLHPHKAEDKKISNLSEYILQRLKLNHPETEIILINLPMSKLYSIDSQYELNQIIRKSAKEFNLKLIDVSGLDMTEKLIDSAHPNSIGMKTLS
jgi:hypothetical protein